MSTRTSFAPGKIILSGEYAMVFGRMGIAIPTRIGVTVTWEEQAGALGMQTQGDMAHPAAAQYLRSVMSQCEQAVGRKFGGKLQIHNALPIGKGMGSSTALVIAIARCVLGDECKDQALAIEDAVNPGHSGMDFAVIWANKPIVFKHGQGAVDANITTDWVGDAILIDTGQPKETTAQLVAWIKRKEQKMQATLDIIGYCTERLLMGESPMTVFHDHHKAQVKLGVVPPDVQTLIEKIESIGSAAKVIGAGGRTGGGGMVLALGDTKKITAIAKESKFSVQPSI